MTETRTLTLEDFADLFGTAYQELPAQCREMIAAGDWRYAPLAGQERDGVVLNLLQRIEQRAFSIVAEGDKARWLKGWGENLEDFVKSEGGLEALVPRYIRPGMPIRLYGDFVRTENPDFELRWYEIFRLWLLSTYFRGFENIFEFGCGSGFNVATLAQMYPDATITGLDWAAPSCEIVEKLRTLKGMKTHGRLFDFFNPDYGVTIPPGSAVLTIGALEQTGDNNAAFLDFLIAKQPALVVHVEPILDWYDPGTLVDHLAIRIHETRNFWRGYPERLERLAAEGKVEILKKKRAFVGSLLLEGYSQLIWRPVGGKA